MPLKPIPLDELRRRNEASQAAADARRAQQRPKESPKPKH